MKNEKDFFLHELIHKLENTEKDRRAVMVWQWVKQNHINLKQFKVLIKMC